MLVRMLSSALAKAAPHHSLPGRATDYLQRKGLAGSPLRMDVVPGEEWKIEADATARRHAAEFKDELEEKLNRALPHCRVEKTVA